MRLHSRFIAGIRYGRKNEGVERKKRKLFYFFFERPYINNTRIHILLFNSVIYTHTHTQLVNSFKKKM